MEVLSLELMLASSCAKVLKLDLPKLKKSNL
jgi:hypothetical protein